MIDFFAFRYITEYKDLWPMAKNELMDAIELRSSYERRSAFPRVMQS
jgi:hypothetical protein